MNVILFLTPYKGGEGPQRSICLAAAKRHDTTHCNGEGASNQLYLVYGVRSKQSGSDLVSGGPAIISMGVPVDCVDTARQFLGGWLLACLLSKTFALCALDEGAGSKKTLRERADMLLAPAPKKALEVSD